MTLNEQQVGYLKDITDYILKFEEDMVIPHTMSEDIVWKARQLGYAMTESNVIWITNKKTED
jgi:hypothetical protein